VSCKHRLDGLTHVLVSDSKSRLYQYLRLHRVHCLNVHHASLNGAKALMSFLIQ
jgi:hypothetical protein